MKTTEKSIAGWKRFALQRTLVRSLAIVALAGAAALTVAGCSDDNGTQPPASFEAKGLALLMGGSDIVVDSSGVTGSLTVVENDVTAEINASFIAKSDNKRSVPGSGYTLSWSVADSTVASVESVSALAFKVRGKKVGNTTATLKLMSGTTTVYTSGAITINVTPAIAGLRMGDTATFTHVDRDTTNENIPGSEKVKVWTVFDEVIASDKTRSISILEVTYDAAGTTELGRDTILLRMRADGSVYQYDLLRKLLLRVSGGEAFSDKLDPYWVKISNTSSASAGTWQSLVQGTAMTGFDSILVRDVSAPDIPASMNVVFKMMAFHQGTQPVTLPGGSFPASVHTEHTLRLNVKLATIPLTVLDDSLHVGFDVTAKEGIVRQTFEGRMLTAKALSVSQPLPVTGFEMKLKALKRKP